jgi:hypothetical protein
MSSSRPILDAFSLDSELAKILVAFASATTLVVALAACSSAPTGSANEHSSTPTSQSSAVSTASTIAPQRDYAVNMVRCLTGKGWNVVLSDQGGYLTPDGIPNEQADQYDADVKSCRAKFGYDKISAPNITRAQAQKLYGDLLNVATCVRGQGYTVPDPPSEQTFVDALVNYPIPIWHPYQVVQQQGGPGELKRIEKACPVPEIN